MKKIVIFLSVIIMLLSFFILMTCNQDSEELSLEPQTINVFDGTDEAKASGVIVEDAYEPDNSMAAAGTILIERTQSRSMFPAGDIDWVKFNLSEGIIYDMSLYSTTDISMTLYDSNGNQLAVGVKTSSYYKILLTCANTGTYFIKVNEVNSAIIGNYSLVIYYSGVLPAFPDFYEPNNSTDTATVIGPEYQFNSSIHNSADVDLYKFTAYTENYIKLIFTADQSDMNFYLYSDGGGTLVMNEIIPAGTSKTFAWGYNGADTVCYVRITAAANYTPFNYYFEQQAIFGEYDIGEPNDTFAAASELSFLTVYDNTLHSVNDIDYHKFYAEAGKTYDVQPSYYVDYEINFILYDKDQSTIIYQENGSGAPSFTTFTCKSSGYYYTCFYISNKNITYTPSYSIMVYCLSDL